MLKSRVSINLRREQAIAQAFLVASQQRQQISGTCSRLLRTSSAPAPRPLSRPGALRTRQFPAPRLHSTLKVPGSSALSSHINCNTMSDDSSYLSFLEKANANPKAGQTLAESESTSQGRSKLDPTTTSTDALPASLKSLPDLMYTSDTDLPFEPVLFNYSGSELPSAEEFTKCLALKSEGLVEELSTQDFDPRGQYSEVIQSVEKAGKGQTGVKVYRVEVSKTRAEYYILTVGERMLVGVVAKAVES